MLGVRLVEVGVHARDQLVEQHVSAEVSSGGAGNPTRGALFAPTAQGRGYTFVAKPVHMRVYICMSLCVAVSIKTYTYIWSTLCPGGVGRGFPCVMPPLRVLLTGVSTPARSLPQ